MTGRLRLAALVLAAAALSACSSAEPTLYTIASVPGAVQTRGPKVIMLRQIGLAHYLERPEIVRSAANYQLNVRTNDWWGEPLGAMLSRVLIDELGQRLPQSTVLGETGAVSTAPDATVELNVQRLDEDGAGALLLQGQASVSFKGHATPMLRNFRLTAPLPTPGARDEVAAISAATGQLADGLAAMLLAAPPAGSR
jgi:uncharacterized lipoprotein YmbA